VSVIYSTLLTNAVNNLIASEQEPMNIFINHSDSLVRTVSEIFSQNQVKLNSFDEPLRDSITITITISLQTLIKKLTDYIQQGEKSPCMFNPHAKERAVEYLQEFINGKPVTDFSEKINELLESFERYDTTTNRIDWHKIDKIIDAFKKIQKSSKIYA
jgi:hypothetical protein